MKTTFALSVLLFFTVAASGQSVGDRILKKSQQRANRKIDRTIDKGLDKVEKGIDESVSGDGKSKEESKPKKKEDTGKTDPAKNDPAKNTGTETAAAEKKQFGASTKFDFVPGTTILFFDDFAMDHVGDFPSKWNTNGSGEVVSASDDSGKWFEMKPSATYVPVLKKKLPEEFTVEFDLMTSGLDKKTSSTAYVLITLDDNELFKEGKNFARLGIPLMQYGVGTVTVRNRISGATVINNQMRPDLRGRVLNGMRISIAVNGKRFRMWADDEKIVDLPTFVAKGTVQTMKLELKGFANDFKEGRIFIKNMKIAEGGVDLRSKLISEGKLSTTAITFDVNSDRLKPESMGMIKELAGVLNANPDVRVKIIGHTDADGDDAHNLTLSKSRAAAVKKAFEDLFGISAGRIETDGKGESQPVAPNDNPEGKAANRRVEFIKL